MPTLNIDPEWTDHPKTLKLLRLAGEGAGLCLMRLWGKALKICPDTGDLGCYDWEEIESMSGWRGEPKVFYDALVNCGRNGGSGFLDADGKLHDWLEHEKHLVFYREKAKQMNEQKRLKSTSKSQGSQQVSEQGRAQASQQASLPVTVTVTKQENEVENDGSTGESSGGPEQETCPTDVGPLSLARNGTNEPGKNGSNPTASGGAPKLRGDDVVEQPLRVEEIEKYLSARWPNTTIRMRQAFAGRIEKLARVRGYDLLPQESQRFAKELLANAADIWAAQKFVTVLERPEEDEQVYNAVKAARNGKSPAQALGHHSTNGNGRGS